jgi:hypothetical protein
LLPQEKTHKSSGFPVLTGIGAARIIPRLLRPSKRWCETGITGYSAVW